jgi:hypothetical protein
MHINKVTETAVLLVQPTAMTMSADHVPAPAPLAAEEACTDDGNVLLSRFEIAARFSTFSIRSSSGTNAWGLPRADQNKVQTLIMNIVSDPISFDNL